MNKKDKNTVGIQGIEYYLPSKTVTSLELSEKFGFPLEFVENKVGVKTLYQADEDERTSDLAIKATNKILNKFPEVKDKIYVLKEYVSNTLEDVCDPYGGDLEVYRKSAKEIKESLEKLIHKLLTEIV